MLRGTWFTRKVSNFALAGLLTAAMMLMIPADAVGATPLQAASTALQAQQYQNSTEWADCEIVLYPDRVETDHNGIQMSLAAGIRQAVSAHGGLGLAIATGDDYTLGGFQLDWVKVEQGGQTVFFDDFDSLIESTWGTTFYHHPVWDPGLGTSSIADGVLWTRPNLFRGMSVLYTRGRVVTSLPAKVTYRVRYPNYLVQAPWPPYSAYRSPATTLFSSPMYDASGRETPGWTEDPYIGFQPGPTGLRFGDWQYQTLVATWRDNNPPLIDADSADVSASEGCIASTSGHWSDQDGGTVALSASRGTVETNEDGTWTWSMRASGASDSGPVEITADDGHGGTASTTFDLTVVNVAPSVARVTGPPDPTPVGQSASISAVFEDPGISDVFSAVVDWGDGTSGAGTVLQNGTGGTVAASHTYAEPGVYPVWVSVTDVDGGCGEALLEGLVVYDPAAGFVTGGGKITCPAGSYLPDPTLSGSATFGFVSKYKQGSAVPDGSTEFQFHAAGLNLKSTSCDWLVIRGTKVQYQGSGTLSGSGDYSFVVTAVNGQAGGGADRLRMRIWDRATGELVFDNERSSGPTTEPVCRVDGGSVVIHRQ